MEAAACPREPNKKVGARGGAIAVMGGLAVAAITAPAHGNPSVPSSIIALLIWESPRESSSRRIGISCCQTGLSRHAVFDHDEAAKHRKLNNHAPRSTMRTATVSP
jgi:hypothetical protein